MIHRLLKISPNMSQSVLTLKVFTKSFQCPVQLLRSRKVSKANLFLHWKHTCYDFWFTTLLKLQKISIYFLQRKHSLRIGYLIFCFGVQAFQLIKLFTWRRERFVFIWLIPNPGVPCSKPLGGSKVEWL